MELAQAGLSDRLAWGIAACLAGAGVSLIGRKNARPGAGVVLFVFTVSAAVTLAVINSGHSTLAPVPQIAWTFALVSLLWSVAAAILEPSPFAPSLSGAPSFRSSSLFRLAALLFGVAAGIILLIVLAMRMIYVGVDLLRGYPWSVGRRHGFQADGFWTLFLLLISCVAAMLTGQARKLASCALWIAAIAAIWACLLGAPFRSDASGGLERSGMTVALTVSLGIVLLIVAFVPRLIDGAQEERTPLPGLAGSFAVIAAGLVLLICYHMLVPVDLAWGGVGGAQLVIWLSATAAAAGAFVLLRWTWHEGLADAACGLASVAVCSLATLAVPFGSGSLAETYPMVFNALLVGLAISTGVWAYLGEAWREDDATPHQKALRPHVSRCAFLNAALALIAGALMTYWPRMPAIAAMDHTLGRVTAGFASHLFLLLVMLWCSRRLRRVTFHLLTIIAVLNAVGFMAVRMVPFASRLE